MTESTLTLQWSDYMNVVADLLGLGRESDPASPSWDSDDEARVLEYVKSGERNFYWHNLASGISHDWTFLNPRTSIILWGTTTGTVSGQGVYASPSTTITATTASFHPAMLNHNFVFDTSETGYEIISYTSTTVIVVSGDASSETSDDTFTITADGDYTLPDDFGYLIGSGKFAEGDGYVPVAKVALGQVLNSRQFETGTSRPQFLAVNTRAHDATVGQRWQFCVWPVPDSDYVMWYQYHVLVNAMTSTNIYPLGGALHSETLLESCLAVAESRMEDNPGVHAALFREKLLSSLQADMRGNIPETLGYNADPSIMTGRDKDWLWRTVRAEGEITYTPGA